MASRITHVVKRSGALVPFAPERIANAIYRAAVAVGGRDRAIAERLSRQVVDILEARTAPGTHPAVEDIQDVVEQVLIHNGHARVAKAYILYREQRAALRSKSVHSYREASSIPWRKIYEVLRWSVDHGVHSVQALNERLLRGEFANLVQESDQCYEEDLDAAVRMIAQRQGELKLVLIAGPSSSGKTTTTIKLAQRLARIGLSLVTLNVDNYFFDLDLHPKDQFGDYDFETPQALDLPLINEHLARLIAGDEVTLPRYDFKVGKRREAVTPMRIAHGDIILIDSLHALYPPMTQGIPHQDKFALYIEPLLQMVGPDGRMVRWTDLRLMRRMVRDATHRAYEPRQTLEHWHYVRSSEMHHILPYAAQADYVVNGALAYELPVMRRRLLDSFVRWAEEYAADPLREDAYQRARRVATLLSAVLPADEEDESAIPGTSQLREFIGGSSYQY